MNKISANYNIDPNHIICILRVNQKKLKIMVDNDVVQQLPKEQDMVAEITEVTTPDISPPTAAIEVKLTY
jgi:hypothetical protein